MKNSIGKLWRVACIPLLVFAAGAIHAAEVTDLRRDSDALARSAALPGNPDLPAVAAALGLGNGDALETVSVSAEAGGRSSTRYRQSFRGVPVWGQQLIVERDASGRVRGLNGTVVRGLAADLAQVQPRLGESAVLDSMRARLAQRFGNVAPVVTREHIELVVFTGRDEAPSAQARLAFAVSFLADAPSGGSPTRPTTLVDAVTGQVLFELDSLAHQTLDCSNGCTLLQQSGLSASRGAWLYRTLPTLPTLSAGATLQVTISGGSGDADLYVRKGSNPTASAYACRPFVAGNNETCTLTVATGENWYVGIYGYRSYSNLTLTARIVPPLAPATSSGPGGNVKTTQYRYGSATTDHYPALVVGASATTCSMANANVKTVHLRNGTAGSTTYEYSASTTAAADVCFNDADAVNDAYSPLNDAHYFGGVVYDLYGSWLGVAPLTFPLTMRVHYSTNYENAFWDGAAMTFGDGATEFYPLVGLDVTAHEVSHGFTEQNSNLVYSGQSGGMNEAYSDIAGEAAEYFMRGSNDFLVGADIVKGTGALRYMCNPTLDGKSIDNVANYTSGLDVHYSSGIYNKAFCELAKSSGWNTRWAFEAFARANQRCWTSSSTFSSGAQCVVDQVEKINTARGTSLNVNAVVDAFGTVGITGLLLPGQTPTITLTAKGTVRSGKQQVQLTWTGSTAASIDVYRDSVKVATPANTGSYTDKPSGKTTYIYAVCNAGTTACSPNVTVQF